jgi:hypothetical protein
MRNCEKLRHVEQLVDIGLAHETEARPARSAAGD